jgi:nickel-dependent lactate racemase
MTRQDGVGSGLLDGNAVHEAFMEIVGRVKPSFAITTVVNDTGQAVEVFCGDWIESHRTACGTYAEDHTVSIEGKRGLVIVSCGGTPYDINMIQAHKALQAASKACIDDGTIILIAQCSEGLGHNDLLNWFDSDNSYQLAERLRERYQVNGQTSWSLLEVAEKFRVVAITQLDDDAIKRMRMIPARSLDDAIQKAARTSRGYIIPNGAKTAIWVA